MQIICLDFETYFDDQYSLKKLSTEEYVRNGNFRVHCCGISVSGCPTRVYNADELPNFFKSVDWQNTGVIAHNSKFDGLILSHWFGIRPNFWFDTLAMGKLAFPTLDSHSLGSLALSLRPAGGTKYLDYPRFKGKRNLTLEEYAHVAEGCARDVDLTLQIFKDLRPLVPTEELHVIDMTTRMFTEPCLTLDSPAMTAYLAKIKSEKESALAALGVSKADLQSAEKFANLLRAAGVEPETKITATGNIGYAFAKNDEFMKELAEYPDDRVQALCAARLGQKSTLNETRTQRLLDMAQRGYLCVFLNYCGAHTTRWSGGDGLNWQNFPRGGDIRKAIQAPPGYVLVVGDLSQIECRMLNWLAGEQDILDAFASNRDLYSEGATRFYGRLITKNDKAERQLGKTLELGCGYGMGWTKFQKTCKQGMLGPPILLTDAEAKRAVNSYRASHPNVKRLWKHGEFVLEQLARKNQRFRWGPMAVWDGQIVGPNLTRLDYRNIYITADGFEKPTRKGPRRIYGALLIENVVQYLSRLVLSQAALIIQKRYRIVMTTHDEVVCVVPEGEAQAALDFVLETLRAPPAWCKTIPLNAEGGYARNYSK
jgi:DNA polymerase bacteriophage-type